jgi:hypothetical protein
VKGVLRLVKTWFNNIFNGGLFEAVMDNLTINPQTEYTSVWNTIDIVYNRFMVPVALGIMIIWFLVAFIQKAANENVTFESVFMAFTKLIIAKFLIEHGLDIFIQLWSFAISSIGDLSEKISISQGGSSIIDEATRNKIWHEITGLDYPKEPGFWKSIPCILQLFIPWVATWALRIIVAFICYSRVIEMFLRVMVAPIALSDFMTEGLHGAGWKYLKSFLAIALQGILIFLIAVIFSKLMGSVFTNANTFMEVVTQYLVFGFSACALMFKSLSLAKELVGVN